VLFVAVARSANGSVGQFSRDGGKHLAISFELAKENS